MLPPLESCPSLVLNADFRPLSYFPLSLWSWQETIKAVFMLLLAAVIAIAIKILGILLVIAFLIVPAAAARPLAATPERMVLLTALVAIIGAVAGLFFSAATDAPGGPAIVLVLAVMALASLVLAARVRSS